MIKELDFVRVACVTPEVRIADPESNAREIVRLLTGKECGEADVVIFPELCVTGYTCGDIFHQRELLGRVEGALEVIAQAMASHDGIVFVGSPVQDGGQLFNCAVALSHGGIIGVVPKNFLSNNEARWFCPAKARHRETLRLCGRDVPFGADLLFESGHLVIGAEFGNDLWVPNPASSEHCLAGANLIVNLSSSYELVSKSICREELIRVQSRRCMCGYIYASSGVSESTTDLVFSGAKIIAENGRILSKSMFDEKAVVAWDIDIDKLNSERIRRAPLFKDNAPGKDRRKVAFSMAEQDYSPDLRVLRELSRMPFVPKDKDDIASRAKEVMRLQVLGLCRRLKATGMPRVVIGASGGLDSTLAILVAVESFQKLERDLKDIVCITLPCFGTSNRTRNNAERLCQTLGCTFIEIPISESVSQHLKDIGQPEDDGAFVQNVTFENAQARERTQLLMDYANKINGLMLGPGDLSELALGFCTYGGDHMSMYAINSGVPKTLARHLVKVYTEDHPNLTDVLYNIVETPISPELLPPSTGDEISQKTEDILGSYELNDFFMYHMLRNQFRLKKIYLLAEQAFPELTQEALRAALKNFYIRFYTQQFKRSCMPDGVKIGSVGLSPRGDFICPSDLFKETLDAHLEDLNDI